LLLLLPLPLPLPLLLPLLLPSLLLLLLLWPWLWLLPWPCCREWLPPHDVPCCHPERSEGSRCASPCLYTLGPFCTAFLPIGRTLPSTPKNKVQKVGMFSDGQSTVVFSHVFTTNPPRFTTQKPRSAPQNLQNPQQHRPFRLIEKKQKKEDPETVLRFRGHRSADGP
jgi:hypothetical protein